MQLNPESLDLAVHAIEALSIVVVGLGGIRKLNHLIDLFRDFPPHRHLPGGFVIYPDGYEPPALGKMNGEAKP